MGNHRVVITGIGIIAPNGIGKKEYWSSTLSGRSGIGRIRRFDVTLYPSKAAGEVSDFHPEAFMERKTARLLSRFAQFALACGRMALEDAMICPEKEDPYRMAVTVGNTLGGKEVDEEQQARHREHAGSVSPFSASQINANYAVGAIAVEFGVKGPNMTFSTGCTSALNAIAYAYETIRDGRADICIACGSETPLTPYVFDAFCVTGSLSHWDGAPDHAVKPFDRNRDGYVLSEGGAAVILESEEHALARHAFIYAEIGGYGVTNDAYSLIRMEPTGKEAARAMELAMENSHITADGIDYINAHGSASLLTDKRETRAIKQVFGERAYTIPVSSIKAMIGQLLGATGSLQVVSTALSVSGGHIPPTINYEVQDPECDLDYTPNRERPAEIRAALVNAFGLGGNNISMVIKKYGRPA